MRGANSRRIDASKNMLKSPWCPLVHRGRISRWAFRILSTAHGRSYVPRFVFPGSHPVGHETHSLLSRNTMSSFRCRLLPARFWAKVSRPLFEEPRLRSHLLNSVGEPGGGVEN